jgi:N utilization substance protein A
MNGSEVLRLVDAIHRDKNIDTELVFEGIEQAILSAARKHFGEEQPIEVLIHRETGQPTVICDGKALDNDTLGDFLGRIASQTAKQVMIQKIREAERDSLFDDYAQIRGQIVTGAVGRTEGGAVIVNLGKVEGILPRSEQIPGESYRNGDRVRAVVLEVRKAGSRVKIILSRVHPDFVRRLFELEIPEIAEQVIEIRSLAREAGYRSKVAVSCSDQKVDAVGACVGVRGARIKNIVDELAGERIDIVRWNDSLQVLVPNALQPAEVEDVILCPMLGRVIVLVREDQLSLAIGRRGQNVRLASKLVGWDIEIMTREELNEQLDNSVAAFNQIPGIPEGLAENLVEQGFFSFDDLSVIEPDQFAEMAGLSLEQVQPLIDFAERESERLEREGGQHKPKSRVAAAQAEEPAPESAEQAEPPTASADPDAAAALSSADTATTEPATEPPKGAESPTNTES